MNLRLTKCKIEIKCILLIVTKFKYFISNYRKEI